MADAKAVPTPTPAPLASVWLDRDTWQCACRWPYLSRCSPSCSLCLVCGAERPAEASRPAAKVGKWHRRETGGPTGQPPSRDHAWWVCRCRVNHSHQETLAACGVCGDARPSLADVCGRPLALAETATPEPATFQYSLDGGETYDGTDAVSVAPAAATFTLNDAPEDLRRHAVGPDRPHAAESDTRWTWSGLGVARPHFTAPDGTAVHASAIEIAASLGPAVSAVRKTSGEELTTVGKAPTNEEITWNGAAQIVRYPAEVQTALREAARSALAPTYEGCGGYVVRRDGRDTVRLRPPDGIEWVYTTQFLTALFAGIDHGEEAAALAAHEFARQAAGLLDRYPEKVRSGVLAAHRATAPQLFEGFGEWRVRRTESGCVRVELPRSEDAVGVVHMHRPAVLEAYFAGLLQARAETYASMRPAIDEAEARAKTLAAALVEALALAERNAVRPSEHDLAMARKQQTEASRMANETPTQKFPKIHSNPLVATLTHDATDAAWRTAGSQFVKLAREPLVGLLSRHLGPEDTALRGKVAAFLDTEIGSAMLAAILSAGLAAIPGAAGDVPQRLARELRVRAMADTTDLVADVLIGPLRQVMALYLKDVQAVEASPAGLDDGGQRVPGVESREPATAGVR